MLSKYFYFFILLSFIFCFGCTNKFKKPDDAVARVYDKFLTKNDIINIIGYETDKSDSADIVNNYIDKWIKEQLVIHIAEKKLPKSKKQFEQQIEAYRNSLILYAYETELIKQKLDTVVTTFQIKQYYEQNPSEFVLKDNIVKVNFVKLPVNSNKISAFKKLIFSEKLDDKQQLKKQCQTYAANYFLEDDVWLLFDDLLKEVPIKTYNQELFLKNNKFIETQDSAYYYLVNIKGFMIKEDLSPLSFEKDRIKNIIINKRKVELVKNMYETVYKTAQKNKDYEIY